MTQKIVSKKVICQTGLNSNRNFLELSDVYPGGAIALQNFEPSLYGGYRRVDGFEPLEADYAEVDPTGAEGKILITSIYDDTVIVARKQLVVDQYEYYFWTPGSDWTQYTTGLTLSTIGIDKIRSDTFNFDGTEKIVFTDGVNNLIHFDGTTWGQVDPNTEDQALDAPSLVTVFKNHIFASGDVSAPHIVAHSAPNDHEDWASASGGGQVIAGFDVVQIKPFRDELYVFGQTKIKKIVVDGSGNFVTQDVATDIGCIAADSVLEINGDLVFLSQDGFRTIAATERVGDVELGILSKNIQQDVTDLIASATLSQVTSVLVRRKSQMRLFFSSDAAEPEDTFGIIAGLRLGQNGVTWEWGRLRGIRASATCSGYMNNVEFVIHGDYDGTVHQQEVGNSFDGQDIAAIYTTPYLDFGDTEIRKTFRAINLFIRPEGAVAITANLRFDWGDTDVSNPTAYLFETDETLAVYGTALYGTSTYAGTSTPLLWKNVEGSGRSLSIQLASSDSNPPYSIQGIVFELTYNDRT